MKRLFSCIRAVLFLMPLTLAACSSGGDGGTTTTAPTPAAVFVCNGPVPAALGAGTNPGGASLSTPRFAYVSNEDNTLSMYTVNAGSGNLRANGYVLAGRSPGELVVDPGNRFLFVPNTGDDTISVFLIGVTDGSLTEIAGSPFPAGIEPSPASVDPRGRFLFVGNTGGNNISVFQIAPGSGALFQAPGVGPFAAGQFPVALTVDPTGQFLYVANADSNDVSAFRISAATGALTPLAGSPYAACETPVSIAMDPQGRAVYVSNLNSGTVSQFVIDPTTGVLRANGVLTIPGVSAPTGLVVDLSGQTLYVVDLFGAVRWNCSINQTTGALSCPNGHGFSGFVTGLDILSTQILVDPSNTYTYVVNFGTSTVSPTARTFPNVGLPAVSTRIFPTSMVIAGGSAAVTHQPNFLYAVNNLVGAPVTVGGYAVNPATGSLTALAGSPFVTGSSTPISGMTAHPTGRFLYMTSSVDSRVYGFDVDSSGMLAATPGSPYVRGVFPGPIAKEPITVEASGRFAYAFNRNSGTLTAYSINQATGALTELIGSPFGLPQGVAADGVSLQADPTGRFLFVTTPGPAPTGNVSTLGIDPIGGNLAIFGSAGPARGAGFVQIKSDGRCLYTIDPGTITHYTLDPFFGTPTERFFQLAIQDPVSAAIDPLGRFLFVTLGLTAPQARVLGIDLFEFNNDCDFTRNPQSLPLSSPAGSSVVDSSGRFLYVAHPDAAGGPGALSWFTITQDSSSASPLTFAGTAITGPLFTGPMAVTGTIQ